MILKSKWCRFIRFLKKKLFYDELFLFGHNIGVDYEKADVKKAALKRVKKIVLIVAN